MILLGDCQHILQHLPENSVDSIVTDPPYGLSNKQPDIMEVLVNWINGEDYQSSIGGFMNAEWDNFVPGPAVWREVYRVLKPGGHILCFASNRTVDLMGISLRMAGFEIKDMIVYAYGSGFPKSRNISKDIDRKALLEWVDRNRPFASRLIKRIWNASDKKAIKWTKLALDKYSNIPVANKIKDENGPVAPVTLYAKKWDGFGTAIKPALMPIVLARKPLNGKGIVGNILKYNTGGLNIEACKVGVIGNEHIGRWPANLMTDGSDTINALFPNSLSGNRLKSNTEIRRKGVSKTTVFNTKNCRFDVNKSSSVANFGDNGSSARFFKTCPFIDEVDFPVFYTSKPSKTERNIGLANITEKTTTKESGESGNNYRLNNHATVKPLSLISYLVRLITPPGGTVLDPFLGSGTTGMAAVIEDMDYIGIEKEEDFVAIANARIEYTKNNKELVKKMVIEKEKNMVSKYLVD